MSEKRVRKQSPFIVLNMITPGTAFGVNRNISDKFPRPDIIFINPLFAPVKYKQLVVFLIKAEIERGDILSGAVSDTAEPADKRPVTRKQINAFGLVPVQHENTVTTHLHFTDLADQDTVICT